METPFDTEGMGVYYDSLPWEELTDLQKQATSRLIQAEEQKAEGYTFVNRKGPLWRAANLQCIRAAISRKAAAQHNELFNRWGVDA